MVAVADKDITGWTDQVTYGDGLSPRWDGNNPNNIRSAGVVTLANIDFTGGVLPPASTYTGTTWVTGAQLGSTVAIVNDTDFPSGKAIEGIYPASTSGVDIWNVLEFPSLGLYDVYIQFKAKMVGTPGACKFLKMFTINDYDESGDGDFANLTMQPQWNSAGLMTAVAYGDGTGVTNDSNNIVRFDDTSSNADIGRSAPGTAVVLAPQAANFSDWTGVNTFRVHFKFNSGTTALNEVADGELWVEINGLVYMNATGLFNRHYTNGPIDRISFFEYTQNNASQLQLRYSDIIISTGGFA